MQCSNVIACTVMNHLTNDFGLFCFPYGLDLSETFVFYPIGLRWVFNWCDASEVTHCHFPDTVNSQFFPEISVLWRCWELILVHLINKGTWHVLCCMRDCFTPLETVHILFRLCLSTSLINHLTRLNDLGQVHRLRMHDLFVSMFVALCWLTTNLVLLAF